MSELKITQEKVTAAFSEANDCPKAISILTALFGKQKPDYTDYHNIKTYEDACEAIGVKPIVRLLVEDEDGHKEEYRKQPAHGHALEHLRQGDEHQRGTGAGGDAKGKHRRNDGKAGQQGGNGIQNGGHDRVVDDIL